MATRSTTYNKLSRGYLGRTLIRQMSRCCFCVHCRTTPRHVAARWYEVSYGTHVECPRASPAYGHWTGTKRYRIPGVFWQTTILCRISLTLRSWSCSVSAADASFAEPRPLISNSGAVGFASWSPPRSGCESPGENWATDTGAAVTPHSPAVVAVRHVPARCTPGRVATCWVTSRNTRRKRPRPSSSASTQPPKAQAATRCRDGRPQIRGELDTLET